jgi:hypothetical protein
MKLSHCFLCAVLVGVTGCAYRGHLEQRGIPVTAERIAELKQICFTSEGFRATVPPEWQLVANSLPSQGRVVFRPRHAQSTIIYTHAVAKRSGQSLEEFIKVDTEGLEQANNMLVVSEGENVAVDSGSRVALTRFLEGDRYGNRSIAAFVDEPHRVVIMGMSTHSENEFAEEERRFLDFVASYKRDVISSLESAPDGETKDIPL